MALGSYTLTITAKFFLSTSKLEDKLLLGGGI